MSQRCKIIPERCIACGLCAIYAPEIFDYDEDGIVLFAQEPNARQQFIIEEKKKKVKTA
ncbi:ferredoxin, partial [Enterococcus faecalis]|nr:ferredoxin [Enterococcus faecalis]